MVLLKEKTKKNLKRRFYYPLFATSSVLKNQEELIRVISNNKDVRILPAPPPGGQGIQNNYFHFVFDFLLPLFVLITKLDYSVKINLIVDIEAKFNHYLESIFPNKLNLIYSEKPKKEKNCTIMFGMNPLFVNTKLEILNSFKHELMKVFKIDSSNTKNKIILIERAEVKLTKGVKTSGVEKRSIINHSELNALIKKHSNTSFEFINVRLEEMKLLEQFFLFDSAALVIAQHGAGLTNCLWMNSGTELIELNNDYFKRHFKNLAKLKKINYTEYKLKSNHDFVNIDDFKKKILDEKQFKKYFNFN